MNRVDDAADIAAGVSQDCNLNGVPDACELVPLVFGVTGDPLASEGEPLAVISGDLDGDGLGDLIVGRSAGVDGNAATVSIFLHTGVRDFASALALAAPGLAATAAGDLDADGALDLVAATADGLALYAGNGAGGFARGVGIAAPGNAAVLVADVDLDGRLDLVTLNPGEGTVSWYRNLADGDLGEGGRGRFGEARTFEVVQPLGNTSLARLFLRAADFDGDGDVDLAIAGGRELSVSILETIVQEGAGGANFAVAHSFRAGGILAAMAVGDVNGDGLPDVVGGTTRGTVTVWGNRGADGFTEVSALRLPSESLALADVDGDTSLDLLIGGRDVAGESTARLLRGPGDGTFLAPQALVTDGTVLHAEDLDSDGDVDLAVAAAARTTVFFQGERGGLVLEGTRFTSGDKPHFLDVGNLNGDEFLDVVTANNDDQTYTVFFGRGDGSLESRQLSARSGDSLTAVMAVDLNEDGVDDLVFNLRHTHALAIHLTQLRKAGGAVEFGEPVLVTTLNADTLFLAKADVDGDGHFDIVKPGLDAVAVHFGDGRGGLSEALVAEVGTRPWAVAAGDLDADGDVDLVTSNGVSSDVSFLLQEEPRRFAPAVTVPASGSPRGVALGDFDQDGDLDVVTANEKSEDVAIFLNPSFLNPGDGLIGTPAHRFSVPPFPLAVTVADFDQDGFLDLVGTHRRIGISVLMGRGGGRFSQVQEFRTGEAFFTVGADMDGDGDTDLVVGNRLPADVFVLLNKIGAPDSNIDSLTAICTPLDFERVSVPISGPEASPLAGRRTKYVLPARDDPALLPTLFVNVARFPLEQDFLRATFPDRFGDLSDMALGDLTLRRASREYFVGAIRRFVLADGQTAYGFEVVTAAGQPAELLSLAETREVATGLRSSFGLEPFVYFPSTPEARAAAQHWEAPDLLVVIVEEPAPPTEPEAHPTFLLEIPDDTVLCGAFAVAGAGRGAREERALKSQVRLRPGTLALPTESETFTAELFEEVLLGPHREPASPLESGTFRVVRLPLPKETPAPNETAAAVYRFTYRQPFTLDDGRLLELEVVAPLEFRAQGEEPVSESQTLPGEFFVALKGREALQGRLDGEPLLYYGSCTYESLPLWDITAELEGGGTLRLEERFEAVESRFETAPAGLVRAEFELGGDQHVVREYFDLSYSAARHNTLLEYWVTLEPPVAIAGVGTVHTVELQAPEPERNRATATASYLGADFEILARPTVMRFVRRPRADLLFVRGDASGDGQLAVLDALVVLAGLFEGAALPCRQAADANDDGRVNIVDAIVVVSALFAAAGELPQPFPNCGADPTVDALPCDSPPACP